MALQSEVSPPIVGDPNKDTKNDGDTKSDENDSSSSTDEEVDLEEGEILDSGEEKEEEEKKDLTNSSLQEAVDKNILKSIEQLVSQAKSDISPPNVVTKRLSPHNSPVKTKKRSKYLDHDRFESNSDQEDGWYSPSRKHKSKFDSKPIDYRKELDAYIGTPPSSPERKHRDDKKKKRSSKKSKKSGKKIIKRKDIKGDRVKRYLKEALRRKVCKFFKEGKCAKGADCGFSHASPHSFKKKELCKFYLSGHCNKGPDCLYMHNEFPCKFYHTGSECYAKDACRFSHETLTNEMKRVLAEYLRIHHGDEDYERKRRRSPSPEIQKPPAKRTCLLGSPPRHIREAEETKRWQEEMQHQQHPGFKINITTGEEGLPPAFQKPNFYQETLPDSPQKHRMNPEAPNFHPPPFGLRDTDDRFPVPSSSDIFVYEEDYQDTDVDEDEDDEVINVKQEPQDYEWNNMRSSNHDLPPVKNEMESFVDPIQQEPDFTSDVKFDETTQFSEMDSSTDCHPASPPHTASQHHLSVKESDEENSNHEIVKSEDYKTTDDSSSAQEPPAAPIVVPAHLPKKQQELFKRIQQHQLKHAITTTASDASNSPKAEMSEPQIQEETPEEVKEKPKEESLWYSSEDDDDDDTEPLTNVLKNLQKAPPPVKPELKPAQNLMAMLNKIQQKAMENKLGSSEPPQGNFFQSLLGTISSSSSRDNVQIPGINLPPSEPARRTLLPDPQTAPTVKKEPAFAVKDPRLKNRDPRLVTTSTAPSLPKAIAPEANIPRVGSSLPNLMPSAFSNTTVVATEPVKDEIPYKLHSIFTRPPNYASYISASQNNPNLLKDPRLKKHMNLAQNKVNGVENSADVDSAKAPKNAPPIPKLLLKFDKNESLAINIFESAKSAASNDPKDTRPQLPKLLDPRMRRRESQNSSGSNTPPHLTIVDNTSPPPLFLKSAPVLEREVKPANEKKWLPSVLEKSWTPPVLEQSWTPPISQDIEQSWAQPMNQEIEKSWTQPIRQEIGQSWTQPIRQDIEQSWTQPIRQDIEQSWTQPIRQDIEQSWTQPMKQEIDSDTEDDYSPLILQIDEDPQSSVEKISANYASAVTSKAKPTTASHLPRAIADPRMAKLQNPMHLRRPRISAPELVNKNLSELKKLNNSPPNENSSDASRASPTDSVEPSESSKTVLSIPKKNLSSERSEEKKKTVHRNRKSSMDYASPLNSCDDPNSNKSLNYNSYNQRPKRTCTIKPVSDSSISKTITNTVVGDTTPDFLSDNSNLDCENSSDVNLKDMFKTIDPTASPFC